jgi:hypothetical protein
MTIAAVLKTGVHCGIEIVPPESLSKLPGSPEIQAGGELALVVQVAEFVTTITYYPHAKDYKLEVVHVYNLVLGVIASASVKANLPLVEVTSQTWGSSSRPLPPSSQQQWLNCARIRQTIIEGNDCLDTAQKQQ